MQGEIDLHKNSNILNFKNTKKKKTPQIGRKNFQSIYRINDLFSEYILKEWKYSIE